MQIAPSKETNAQILKGSERVKANEKESFSLLLFQEPLSSESVCERYFSKAEKSRK